MLDKNKAILEEANAAIAQGNNEGFLSYCDIWRFRGGKIVELRAFVIKTEVKDETSSAA